MNGKGDKITTTVAMIRFQLSLEAAKNVAQTGFNICTTITSQVFDALVSSTCDDQVKEALTFFKKVLGKTALKEKIWKAWSYGKPFSLLLALTCRLHHYKVDQRIQQECSEIAKFTAAEFEEVKRIAQWAIDAYLATWNPSQIRSSMNLEDQDEILMRFCQDDDSVNDRDYIAKFIIFTDWRSKSIVLAIRGTCE